ncbi:hypothetical protein A2U01_0029339, partial [Trifolium medium]|nr:hypothetical protein [Trifolium medium]
RGFKERYYVVKPVSQLAVDSLFEPELDVEEDGAFVETKRETR